MSSAPHPSPFRVGRRVRVRWPVKEPSGTIYTAGAIVEAGDRVTVDVETADGRRAGIRRQYDRDRLLIETTKAEG